MEQKKNMKGNCFDIVLPLSECNARTFQLEKAVCNHGLFMMAPNHWNPSKRTLQRPLRLSDSTTSVLVSISSPPPRLPDHSSTYLLVRVHGTRFISSSDQHAILGQVRRMLRISEKDERDVQEFQKVHAEAKKSGFGRLFRSPTLFEDAVKSLLLCNCGWGRTLQMAQALCELQLKIENAVKHKDKKRSRRKRKRTSNIVSRSSDDEPMTLGNFPNAKELAALDEGWLNKRCNLGYRAGAIIQFAKRYECDDFKLIREFEDISAWNNVAFSRLFNKLKIEKGFGPFVCANVLMCCGFYENVPGDSETVRHLLHSHHHEVKECSIKNVNAITQKIYDNYAPFQCLAYWWELLEYYEVKVGRLSELQSSRYNMVTGTINCPTSSSST